MAAIGMAIDESGGVEGVFESIGGKVLIETVCETRDVREHRR